MSIWGNPVLLGESDASVLVSKTITQNGTYDPANDNADGYSEVVVNVTNSYAAGDEGKVVSNGALAAQTARSSDITQNGTYDTTLNNSVTVNVSGGGGGATILRGTTGPTAAQGSNGDIYLACGISLAQFSVLREGSMSITCSTFEIIFDYLGGGSIGGQAYMQIDLTNVDYISYRMSSGHHTYNNYQTPRFCPFAILENSVNPANSFVANSMVNDETRITSNDTILSYTFDTSEMTGNYWLVFCSYGCDSTVDEVVVDGDNIIIAAYVKVNGVWQDLIGSDIDDVNLSGNEP